MVTAKNQQSSHYAVNTPSIKHKTLKLRAPQHLLKIPSRFYHIYYQ